MTFTITFSNAISGGISLKWHLLFNAAFDRVATVREKSGKFKLTQSQGKVREFYCKSGNFVICYQSEG